MEDCRKARKLVGWLEQTLAERDIMDCSIPVDTILETRFEWKTKSEREALRDFIFASRASGWVDWDKKI